MSTLRDRINHWVAQGYTVRSETPTSAQLARPKRFSAAEFIAMPLYLLEYLGQKEKTVYLAVEPDGSVSEKGSAFDRSRYRKAQDRSAAQRAAIVVVPLVILVVGVLILQALSR